MRQCLKPTILIVLHGHSLSCPFFSTETNSHRDSHGQYFDTWEGGTKASPEPESFWFCTTCLHVFFSHLSLLCNPSPRLPRHHSSSPCKLSCSEPQQTLLSVELRIPSFFNMFASIFLVFSKLCLSSISCLFFKPFLAFLRFFKSFLPAMSSFSQLFPQFSLVFPSLPLICSSLLMVFSTFSSIFLHFLQPFATPSSASLLIPLQTVLLRTPTDAALRWASDP